MYLDEEIFNSEFNERSAKQRAQSYMKLKNGYKEPNDKHVQSVINKFAHRSEVGFAKYGTNLERKDLNLTEWLNHLQEELMDATLYIEKLKEEFNPIKININMSKEKLTDNEKFCLKYLEQFKDRFVSPTEIGENFRKGYHSSFASPICKRLVEYGYAERNLRGHYKFIKTP